MYWAILIAANLPLYIGIGWLLFDNAENAAETVYETVFVIVRAIFVPRIIRVLLDMDDEGAYGLFEIGAFIVACVALTYGEHYLLTQYVFS